MVNLEINVTTEPKGGNPGGLVTLSVDSKVQEAYLKYCPGSRMRPQSRLTAVHQPIYEALTFQLANLIGLTIPKIYVVDNSTNKVKFSYDPSVKKRMSESMPFYFASIIEKDPQLETIAETELRRQVEGEEPYRELLMIDDILGKRQNYSIKDNAPIYFDLGCSFVRAVQGMLYQKQSKHHDGSRAQIKEATKRVKPFFLVKKGTDQVVRLTEILDSIDKITIPVIDGPYKTKDVSITQLLNPGEIEEIYTDHLLHMYPAATDIYRNHRLDTHPILLKSAEK